eukprot:63-Pelagococcus_subviridis.AAC.1
MLQRPHVQSRLVALPQRLSVIAQARVDLLHAVHRVEGLAVELEEGLRVEGPYKATSGWS